MCCRYCQKLLAPRDRLCCSACRQVHEKLQHRKREARRLKRRRLEKTRVRFCEECFRCFPAVARGPLSALCQGCKLQNRKQKEKERSRRRCREQKYDRVCVVCKQSFSARDRRARYCSQKCVGSLRAQPQPECKSCGGPVGCRKSKECWNCYQGKLEQLFVEIKCKHCGKQCKKRRWNSLTPKYCSRSCFFASIRSNTTEQERQQRREYARNRGGTTHRKRCRKFGGFYNAKVTRLAVLDACSWRCYICGHKVSDDVAATRDRKATIDHVVPLEKGGPHDWQNVKACCRKCNIAKQAKWDGQKVIDFSEAWGK